MKIKICPTCNQVKSLSEFHKDKSKKDGLHSTCKNCYKIYYQTNSERLKRNNKIYRENNKNKIKQKTTKYKITNKSKISKYNILYNQKYYRLNKISILNQKRKYTNIRRKSDIRFRFSQNLRSRVSTAIRGNTKSLNTMMLVGCEIDYLMYYIQEQFTEGMNWNNYGKWHIDHIKPCIRFDFNKPEEQRKCFNFRNLQPLWAEDNRKKGDKIL